MKKTFWIVLIIVAALGYYWYSKAPAGIDNLPPPGAAVGLLTGETKEFTVTSKDFTLTPVKLTVNQGDRVKITFKNEAGSHDFKIDEYQVATKQLTAGGEETIEFTADRVGTFESYCSVGNHRATGMKGTFTVL